MIKQRQLRIKDLSTKDIKQEERAEVKEEREKRGKTSSHSKLHAFSHFSQIGSLF